MEINSLKNRLTVLLRIEDLNRALNTLEKLSIIADVASNEIILRVVLFKKLLFQQFGQLVIKLKQMEEEELQQINKSIYKFVLDTNSERVIGEISEKVEKFVNCLNNLSKKCDSSENVILITKIKGKCFTFLYSINEKNIIYHQMALECYTNGVELALKTLEKTNKIRLKIFLNYIRFLRIYCNDTYRPVLFCLNLLSELTKLKEKNDYIEKFIEKLKNFFKQNSDAYNETLRIYHPELLENNQTDK